MTLMRPVNPRQLRLQKMRELGGPLFTKPAAMGTPGANLCNGVTLPLKKLTA